MVKVFLLWHRWPVFSRQMSFIFHYFPLNPRFIPRTHRGFRNRNIRTPNRRFLILSQRSRKNIGSPLQRDDGDEWSLVVITQHKRIALHSLVFQLTDSSFSREDTLISYKRFSPFLSLLRLVLALTIFIIDRISLFTNASLSNSDELFILSPLPVIPTLIKLYACIITMFWFLLFLRTVLAINHLSNMNSEILEKMRYTYWYSV